MEFEARSWSGDGLEHVAITGELDLESVPTLEDVLRCVGRSYVEIDASGLTFVDVVGVSALLHCQKVLSARGGGLVVRDAPPILVLVCETLGLGDALLGTNP